MRFGYHQPRYLLPFEHRHSYVTGMFHLDPPLTADQRNAVDMATIFEQALRPRAGAA